MLTTARHWILTTLHGVTVETESSQYESVLKFTNCHYLGSDLQRDSFINSFHAENMQTESHSPILSQNSVSPYDLGLLELLQGNSLTRWWSGDTSFQITLTYWYLIQSSLRLQVWQNDCRMKTDGQNRSTRRKPVQV